MMDRSWCNPDMIQRHSLDSRQFMDFRESTLPNGSRIIEAYNSSGLSFSILPDRGLDIWAAHYQGMPLTWIAPGSPHPPDYGQGWLRLFNGGLLVTCGLTHVGPPEEDRDIHGDYTRLRSGPVSVEAAQDSMRLSAVIQESSLFGPQIRLTRTYTLALGKAEIHIHDTVENIGDQAAPFMLMYHCNPGYPLVREGTELLVASEVYPRDADAESGAARRNRYEAASAGFAEQVYFHHVRSDSGSSSNVALAALVNADIGLQWAWNTRQMPYLTQWKNTRQGIYVCGIEPGNCIPEGRNAAREAGRLVTLGPGEQQHFDLTLSVLDGAEAVQTCRETMARLQNEGSLIAGCDLNGYQRHESKP